MAPRQLINSVALGSRNRPSLKLGGIIGLTSDGNQAGVTSELAVSF